VWKKPQPLSEEEILDLNTLISDDAHPGTIPVDGLIIQDQPRKIDG